MFILFRILAFCLFFSFSGFGQTSGDQSSFVPYRVGNKWGFSDSTGNIVIQPLYEEIDFMNNGYFKVRKGDLWGLTNRNGKIVLPINYTKIYDFGLDGTTIVKINKNVGLIDTTGRILVPALYFYVEHLTNNLYKVALTTEVRKAGSLNTRLGIYRDGKLIIPVEYYDMKALPSGNVTLQKEYGPQMILIVNKESVSLEKRKSRSDFNEGLASIDLDDNGYFRFINDQGKIAFEGVYKDVKLNQQQQAFSNGRAAVSKDGKSFGYIDRSGKVIVPLVFSDAGVFKNGLAIIKKEGLYNIIDTKGILLGPYTQNELKWSNLPNVIEEKAEKGPSLKTYYNPETGKHSLKYYYINSFQEGFAKVTGSNGIGYINEKGEEVVPAIYEDGMDFSEGLAAVKKGGKWGFIDSKGKVVIPFNYLNEGHYFYQFNDGLAPVNLEFRRWFYIDKNGKKITEEVFYDNIQPKPFTNGFATVIVGWQEITDGPLGKRYKGPIYNIIDQKGKKLTNLKLTEIGIIENKLFNVCQDSGCGLLNSAGKIIIPLEYQFELKLIAHNKFTLLHNGYLKVLSSDRNKTLGFMSLTGKKYWQD